MPGKQESIRGGIAIVGLGWIACAGCSGFTFHDSVRDLAELPAGTEVVRIRGLPDVATESLGRLDGLATVDLCSGWRKQPLQFTSDGFVQLAALGLPKLRAVYVCHANNISDESLRALGSISTLEFVSLEWCSGFSISGIEGLLKARIVQLDLTGCAHVDDSWIEVLTYYGNLRGLGVSGTRITPSGVAKLQAALPYCIIDTTRTEWDRP